MAAPYATVCRTRTGQTSGIPSDPAPVRPSTLSQTLLGGLSENLRLAAFTKFWTASTSARRAPRVRFALLLFSTSSQQNQIGIAPPDFGTRRANRTRPSNLNSASTLSILLFISNNLIIIFADISSPCSCYISSRRSRVILELGNQLIIADAGTCLKTNEMAAYQDD